MPQEYLEVSEANEKRNLQNETGEKAGDPEKGFCECGCGFQTKICNHTDNRRSNCVKGKPYRFIPGHNRKILNQEGKNNHNWKGDKVGYFGLHDWVYKNLGQPSKCSDCGTTDLNKRFEWANISGKYKRVLSDWKRLCCSCHKKFDGLFGENNPNAKLTEKDVGEIKKLYNSGYCSQKIGKLFNVERHTIWRIVSKRNWKHIIP